MTLLIVRGEDRPSEGPLLEYASWVSHTWRGPCAASAAPVISFVSAIATSARWSEGNGDAPCVVASTG